LRPMIFKFCKYVLSKDKIFTCFCYLVIFTVLQILKMKLICAVQNKKNIAFE